MERDRGFILNLLMLVGIGSLAFAGGVACLLRVACAVVFSDWILIG